MIFFICAMSDDWFGFDLPISDTGAKLIIAVDVLLELTGFGAILYWVFR